MSLQNLQDFSSVPLMRKGDKTVGEAINKFQKIIEDKYNVKIGDRHELHKWSIEHVVEFWSEYWDFLGVICSKKFDQVIDLNVPLSEAPEWFQGARLNFTENLLKYNDDRVAFIAAGEDKVPEYFTHAELKEKVREYAAAFKKFGLKKGDIVACYISNRVEAVFTMHAAISIGAIWTACTPFLGIQAVTYRLQLVKPKMLLTVDRFKNNNVEIELLQKVKEIVDDLPSIEKVMIVPSKPESKLKDVSGIRSSCFLDDFLESGRNEDGTFPELIFEQVSLSHPIFISFTSGTTGLPKAIVHGSAVLFSIDELSLRTHYERDNLVFVVIPVGQIAWSTGVSLIIGGVSVLLFEGLPFFLSPTYFWDMVDKFGCTNLFIPSMVLDEMDKQNFIPSQKHHLKTFKGCFAGGSVVKPQNYDFMYKKVKSDIFFSSAYGSTETIGVIIGADPTMAIYRGEVSIKHFGIDVQCVDETGQPVEGELGELVISQPYPGLPLGMWDDPDKIKYKNCYFQTFPGKFALKDYGIVNPITKGIRICGRSDDTLIQRGKRFGSSEIYNIVERFPEICDSICISQCNKDMDERAVLFLKIRESHRLNDDLLQRIREKIAIELSSAHIPEVITVTEDIPYNVNGKKLEITVKNIIHNRPYDTENIRNPESLKNFINNPDLKKF